MLADLQYVRNTGTSEAQKVFKSGLEQIDSDKPSVKFSVRKLLLWIAIVGGGFSIITQSGNGLDGVLIFKTYIVLVCGLSIFIENPSSSEIWLPVGMLLLIPVLFGVSLIGGNNSLVGNEVLVRFGLLGVVGGVVYGFVLLGRFVGRTLCRSDAKRWVFPEVTYLLAGFLAVVHAGYVVRICCWCGSVLIFGQSGCKPKVECAK